MNHQQLQIAINSAERFVNDQLNLRGDRETLRELATNHLGKLYEIQRAYAGMLQSRLEWTGLSKKEVGEWALPEAPTVFEFAKFVEAKLKEKNQ